MEGNNHFHFLKKDEGKSKSKTIEIPSITLPKGGGAIRGVDEKFSINAVNGTVSFTVHLPVSAARGVAPNLTLSYNSGAGNGIFGLGWTLNLPSIKRKTDKELPRYFDETDSDTFLFSEAEDLVPEYEKATNGDFTLDANGNYKIKEKDDGFFKIRFYRPRIEGLFARIERWSHKASGEIKWRVITRDNVTTLFGWTANSRISDPKDETRIFEWLPEFVFDDKGNCSHYFYKKEKGAGFDGTFLHNRNRKRNGKITYTNAYLEKIFYGNKITYQNFGDAFPETDDYLFSTVFDYGDGDADRTDAFSEYRAGFEIRTTKLCQRVLLFHHFTDDKEYDGLVKSLDFGYDTGVEVDFTFLKTVIACGFIKKEDGSYSIKQLPAMEFDYQRHDWNKDVKTIDAGELMHAPVGLDEQKYQFTDLFNEGLAGILTEQANGWYYKHNLGDGKFEHAKLVSPKPSFAGLGGVMQLSDLDADGGKQLVSFAKGTSGFFELNDENEWENFRSFKSLPNVDFGDSNTRMLDLNGDGKPEIVITEDSVFTWYPSEGRNGFSQAQKTLKPFDEEDGPHIVFADAKQTIFLADMSGDGLTDIVRIRNSEVCYWSNLGYGKFGSKTTFDDAPVFDHPDSFNPLYIRLADIDGSGTTDIIYLGENKFTCWKNLSGNRFGKIPFEIETFPEIHSQANITVTDLLGNGVSCLVWSSSLTKDGYAPLRYIDLMNGRKPHILISYKNNLGKEVSLEYKPSTKFYLEDKENGKPWVTKLHFPVHCLSKTVTEDKVSGSRFVSRYKYHHGYYDHAEREFRGFGMVEQIDSETFEHWAKGKASNIVEEPLHQEPVITKTWFHTGAFLGKERILNQFKDDYWYAEMERKGFATTYHEMDLPDARLVLAPRLDNDSLDQLSVQEWHEALRACKGMTLRSEVFAKDAVKFGNTPEAHRKELTPFNVATHNCVIELLQPKGKNKFAVFVVRESEAITYSYERNPEDPRIAHNLNIKLDEYGNVLESAAVVYPRLIVNASLPAETQEEQNKTVITYTQNGFTNDVISDKTYRLRLPSEAKTFELKGVAKSGAFYTPADFADILLDARSDTPLYHEIDKPLISGKAQKRLIEQFRSMYYSNNLEAALPLHELESLAIPFESYQLAYTPELLTDIFETRVTPDLLKDEGKFIQIESDWWIRSGTVQYLRNGESTTDARNRFFVPISYTDPFGAVTKVKYYGSYSFFIEETEDDFGNKAGVEKLNFRTLTPQKMRDINGNFTEVISDELGFVKAAAVMGKGLEADDLAGFSEITETDEGLVVQNFFNAADSVQLTEIGKNLLQNATTRFVYDLQAYVNEGKPTVVSSITREKHFHSPENNSPEQETVVKVQISFEYSNGLGEVLMKKAQAEPGIAKQIVIGTDNSVTVNEINTEAGNPKQLRWIGSGRVVKNNKGNPVKQYEPSYSVTHQFEDVKKLPESDVVLVMYYDAVGRLIKTKMPDETFSKVEFDSWKQVVFDANDTVLESDWFQARINLPDNTDREKIAAQKAAKHADTPNVLHFDTLGRPVLSIEHNKNIETEVDEFYHTKVKLDTEGNLRTLTDARGNTVMQYKYDMLGNRVYQNSMDAGQRWLLLNISGNPLRTFNERNHVFHYKYDKLQRPTESKVINEINAPILENIFDRIFYGESLLLDDRSNEADLQAKNVLGKPIKHYDTGGLIDTPDYNFKGQPKFTTRRLFKKYKEVANWTDDNLEIDLEEKEFKFITETDALGRITKQIAPDDSEITPFYNEAGLLNQEIVKHKNGSEVTYIRNIDYNEKGQREKIVYGNQVSTKFIYDKKNFRLRHLETRRQNSELLQDLYYTFDPVGNITHIEDKSIPREFSSNEIIEPISEFTYDAIYRLVKASGREKNASPNFSAENKWNDAPFMNSNLQTDIRNYTQHYKYDAVGNIDELKHRAAGGDWTRKYTYETINNRLISTQIGSNPSYFYPHHDKHGFITKMPHLTVMDWNFKEELVKTSTQSISNGGTPITTYYQYDGSGQRIRKITENEAAQNITPTKKEERIYIAGYELYIKHSDPNAGLERTSLSLMDEGHRFVMIETRNEIDDGTELQLTRYQMHNHLGSAVLELDDSAQVISYEEYHPYGTTAYQANNANIKAAAKRYRYTGMERDEETGLSYHSARYYVPWLGRWLSGDPIGIKDGVNLYKYSDNNPIIKSDRNGKQAEESQFHTIKKGDVFWNLENHYNLLHGTLQKLNKEINPNKLRIGDSIKVSNIYDKTEIDSILKSLPKTPFKYGYSLRKNDLPLFSSFYNSLFSEFTTGDGPTNSVFLGGHQATKDIRDTNLEIKRLREIVYKKFNTLDKMKEYATSTTLQKDNSKKVEQKPKGAIYTRFRSHGGLFLPWNESGFTSQFIGTFSADVFLSQDSDHLIFVVNDSKSKTSLFFHIPFIKNRERDPKNKTSFGNTYQKYIWYEKLDTSKFTNEQFMPKTDESVIKKHGH